MTLRTVLRVLTFGLLGRVEATHRLEVLKGGVRDEIERKRAESHAAHLEACRRLESQADRTIILSEETMAMTGENP